MSGQLCSKSIHGQKYVEHYLKNLLKLVNLWKTCQILLETIPSLAKIKLIKEN